ncbi:glycoside hydrolase family 97 protein [Chitinophaga japonensis]|uniref:Alpha-glucosidase n=1 Tax=Chitinophaga japonensis TaxID=104662 RepID=A0A562STA6_CHIJA|nr:alpha-glucosidase [Chitinophaga japonensis]
MNGYSFVRQAWGYAALFFGIIGAAGCSVQSAVPAPIEGTQVTVSSPDSNLTARFYQVNDKEGRSLYYEVTYKGRTVIRPSVLDIRLDNHLSENAMALPVDTFTRWTADLVVKDIRRSSQDTSWKPVAGERALVRDHYNGATVSMQKANNPLYRMDVQLRVYNEGVAIRYYFPEHEKGSYYRVVAEHTEFALPAGTTAFHALWGQAPYRELPLRDWPGEAERPLTLKLPGGLYACLAEAQLVDYARTKFTLSPDKRNTVVTSIYTPADLISPFGTPWRVIMVADRPGALMENDFLLLDLNAPSRIKDTGWIKPGKIIRVMIQNTAEAKAHIDFAVKHRLQYILFDWKWYGPSFTFNSDATKVAIPDFDLPAIIQYGKERGVGVWLYVNQQALLAQSDSLFSVYRQWGVKGVKFGFVQVGSHRWTTWMEDMFKKAAENHIMINVHDDWRPTGEQRTWPNLMTAEGIRGNEEMPDATHNTILPFTRYIAGAADYTICYYDPRIKTTHAHQLALAAIYYSPLQTLYWYDSPALSDDEPELEFWDHIPVTWDETRVLQGEPGEHISVARRKGAEWFVGTITNNSARTLQLSFDFLPPGQSFLAKIYTDDPAVPTKTKVKVTEQRVNASTVMPIVLPASGGHAMWLKPDQVFKTWQVYLRPYRNYSCHNLYSPAPCALISGAKVPENVPVVLPVHRSVILQGPVMPSDDSVTGMAAR